MLMPRIDVGHSWQMYQTTSLRSSLLRLARSSRADSSRIAANVLRMACGTSLDFSLAM